MSKKMYARTHSLAKIRKIIRIAKYLLFFLEMVQNISAHVYLAAAA